MKNNSKKQNNNNLGYMLKIIKLNILILLKFKEIFKLNFMIKILLKIKFYNNIYQKQ